MTRICVDCDRAITGNAIVAAEGHSASGAREDMYAHASGDPECTVRTGQRGVLHRALDAVALAPPNRPHRG
ncbi:hypothetical protein [Streptomyces sp. NPDC008125]|uniref:hypothetical protein n=1 Tax=Streptomyces sp. NPDC008125 TaxID=3364811 RepID=UPI0036E3EED8